MRSLHRPRAIPSWCKERQVHIAAAKDLAAGILAIILDITSVGQSSTEISAKGTMLHPAAFFWSFAVGLLLVYLITPARKVVIKFPAPYGTSSYRDQENCYDYVAAQVACDGNATPHPALPALGA